MNGASSCPAGHLMRDARLTVVTAAYQPDMGFLSAAAVSIMLAVSEPVIWRIQLDQATLHAADTLADQVSAWIGAAPVHVHVASHTARSGPGAARMYAAAATTTRWLTVLDADDLLPVAALDRQLALLDAHPDARWAVGSGHTLHADGERIHWPHDLPETVPAGLIARYTRDTGHMPTMPISGIWNTAALLALGGWPATPVDEDTSVKLALTSVFPGVATPDSVYVYRRDVPGQVTVQPRDPRLTGEGRAQAVARLRGLADIGLAPADLLAGDWTVFLSGHSA